MRLCCPLRNLMILKMPRRVVFGGGDISRWKRCMGWFKLGNPSESPWRSLWVSEKTWDLSSGKVAEMYKHNRELFVQERCFETQEYQLGMTHPTTFAPRLIFCCLSLGSFRVECASVLQTRPGETETFPSRRDSQTAKYWTETFASEKKSSNDEKVSWMTGRGRLTRGTCRETFLNVLEGFGDGYGSMMIFHAWWFC